MPDLIILTHHYRTILSFQFTQRFKKQILYSRHHIREEHKTRLLRTTLDHIKPLTLIASIRIHFLIQPTPHHYEHTEANKYFSYLLENYAPQLDNARSA